MRRPIVLATIVATAVVGLPLVGSPVVAGAEPGDLDGSHGTCGIKPLAVQPSRTGTAGNAAVTVEIADSQSNVSHIVVRRLRTNGATDRTFGSNGATTLAVLGSLAGNRFTDVTSDAAGRITIGLGSELAGLPTQPLGTVIRLLPDGRPDPSFAGNGQKVLNTPGVDRVVVRPDGEALVLAPATSYQSGLRRLERIDLDGTAHGVTAAAPPGAPGASASVQLPIAMDASGFYGVDGSVPGSRSIRRWNDDGSLDGGFTAIPVPTTSEPVVDVADLQPAPGGGLLVLWNTWWDDPTIRQGRLDRYTATGAPDATFGTGGSTVVPMQSLSARENRLHVDANGTMQVVTDINQPNGNPPQVVQITAAGSLDRTFGARGVSRLFGRGRNGIAFTRRVAIIDELVDTGLGLVQPARLVMSREPLRAGAGLMLQWDGDAWPTRLGSDPGPECPSDTPYWPDADLARGITAAVAGRGGYVVDAYGGVHAFSIGLQRAKPAAATAVAYWPGWDIVRGIAARADGHGGYTLDAYGALHPFATATANAPAATVGGPYWPGWDITRGVALMPDGASGYVLDGFGGLHPFTTPGHPAPPVVHPSGYWPGWDIARGIGILPDGSGGYVVDAFGGTHPFGIGDHTAPRPPGANAQYHPGDDWVRGFTFVPTLPLTGSGRRRDPAADPPGVRTRGHHTIEAAPGR